MARPKLSIVSGTTAPDSPKESVRQSLRKTRIKSVPQCPSCAGRTYIEVKTGSLTQQVCVHCFVDKKIVIME